MGVSTRAARGAVLRLSGFRHPSIHSDAHPPAVVAGGPLGVIDERGSTADAASFKRLLSSPLNPVPETQPPPPEQPTTLESQLGYDADDDARVVNDDDSRGRVSYLPGQRWWERRVSWDTSLYGFSFS